MGRDDLMEGKQKQTETSIFQMCQPINNVSFVCKNEPVMREEEASERSFGLASSHVG